MDREIDIVVCRSAHRSVVVFRQLLGTMRVINPDPQITSAYRELLGRYPYLRDHLADALIAASAWVKSLSADNCQRSPL